jgi:hypothetical protein
MRNLFLPLLASTAMAHMEMKWPIPLRSRFNSELFAAQIDYNNISPLAANGSQFPCKGYLSGNGNTTSMADLVAGTEQLLELSGTAFHGGGSCQLSLSFDQGLSFHVFKSFIGNCPTGPNPNLTYIVPANVPNGQAVLSWTWLNHIGNREFYQNCAIVTVSGGNGTLSDWNKLPGIFVANQESINNCTTVENVDPVFPDPGAQVVYGAGLSAMSPKSPSACEIPLPIGPATYPNQPMTRAPPAISIFRSVTATVAFTTTSPSSTILARFARGFAPATITSTSSPTNMPDMPMPYMPQAATPSCTTGVQNPDKAMAAPAPTIYGPSNQLPYVSAETLDQFLPCNPGSFLCSDATSWYTCSWVSANAENPLQETADNVWTWGWTWLRTPTADGMECVPRAILGLPEGLAQQPGAPVGYYRSDEYAAIGSTTPTRIYKRGGSARRGAVGFF